MEPITTRRILRYIINIGLLAGSYLIPCHQAVAAAEGVKSYLWPTVCYIGADIAKPIYGWSTGVACELNSTIDFHRIFFDVDYGFAKITRDEPGRSSSFVYTRGHYGRIGVNFNVLPKTVDYNQWFIGFRYARSFFSFRIKSTKRHKHPAEERCDNDCENVPSNFQDCRAGEVAHWFEVVTGVKVRIIHCLAIGSTFRFKFRCKLERNGRILAYEIPGFGFAEDPYAFGYSVYLLIRIPLQKHNKGSQPI